MKITFFPHLLTLLLIIGHSQVQAQSPLPWENTLPFDQAIIEYDIQGTETGTETLYIEKNGQRRATHRKSTMKMMGLATTTQTIQITDPDTVYTYDLSQGTGSKTSNPNKIYQQEYEKLTKTEKDNVEKNTKELGGSLMSGLAGETMENAETILGYPCDVTSVANITTVSIIHGTDIPLRTKTAVMGITSSTSATKVDTKTPIPAKAFAAPEGITAKEDPQAEAMMTEMVTNMIAQLKQPDGAQKLKENPMGMIPGGAPNTPSANPGTLDADQQKAMEEGLNMLKELLPQQ